MKRRDFISLLGGAAAWPLAARAQQSERVRRVGVLMAHKEGDPEFQDYLGAFRQGLLKLGWVEGRNVSIDARWEHSKTRNKGKAPRKNFWRYSLTSSLRKTLHQQSQCCNKRVLSRLFFWLLPTRLGVALSAVWRDRAATLLVLPSWSRLRVPNGWSCSKRLRPASIEPLFCSIRQQHRLPITT